MNTFTHINLFFLLFTHILIGFPSFYIQLFAHIAETLHLNRCFLTLRIFSLNCRLSNHGHIFQINFIMHYQSRYKHSSICCKLKISQMPNIFEKFSDWGWSISWGMSAQNSTKYQRSPILTRTQLCLTSHIEHTYRLSQFAILNKLAYTLVDQFAFVLSCLFKLPLKFNQVYFILLMVFSLIFVYRLCVGNYQLARSANQVFLHLHILIQAPLIQIFFHMLNHYSYPSAVLHAGIVLVGRIH